MFGPNSLNSDLKTSRDTLRVASNFSGLKITPRKVKKVTSKSDIIRALKKTIRDQRFRIDKLQSENTSLKGGTAAACNEAKYLGMELEPELAARLTNSLQIEHIVIEYNLEDLQRQKRDLEAEKAMMMAVEPKNDEILQDIKDLEQEIAWIERRMENEAAVEAKMDEMIRRSTISARGGLGDETSAQELRVKFNLLRKLAKEREQDLVDFVEEMHQSLVESIRVQNSGN